MTTFQNSARVVRVLVQACQGLVLARVRSPGRHYQPLATGLDHSTRITLFLVVVYSRFVISFSGDMSHSGWYFRGSWSTSSWRLYFAVVISPRFAGNVTADGPSRAWTCLFISFVIAVVCVAFGGQRPAPFRCALGAMLLAGQDTASVNPPVRSVPFCTDVKMHPRLQKFG